MSNKWIKLKINKIEVGDDGKIGVNIRIEISNNEVYSNEAGDNKIGDNKFEEEKNYQKTFKTKKLVNL